jgi:hypothetical protein
MPKRKRYLGSAKMYRMSQKLLERRSFSEESYAMKQEFQTIPNPLFVTDTRHDRVYADKAYCLTLHTYPPLDSSKIMCYTFHPSIHAERVDILVDGCHVRWCNNGNLSVEFPASVVYIKTRRTYPHERVHLPPVQFIRSQGTKFNAPDLYVYSVDPIGFLRCDLQKCRKLRRDIAARRDLTKNILTNKNIIPKEIIHNILVPYVM